MKRSRTVGTASVGQRTLYKHGEHMIGKIIQPELEAFITKRDFAGLQAVLNEMLVPDIVEVINDISSNHRALIFRLLSKQTAM
ncbi:MAG: hypothetical protein IT282_07170, partial [Bacteroidetes bacterium]|nr:hypothetical protein [Bacteroidota bacterium]